MNNNIDTILEYIHGSDDFIVTSHVNPDGDNIGSTLSVYYFLKKIYFSHIMVHINHILV